MSLARVLETELGFFGRTVHTLTVELSLSRLLAYRGAIQSSEDIPGEPRLFFHSVSSGTELRLYSKVSLFACYFETTFH